MRFTKSKKPVIFFFVVVICATTAALVFEGKDKAVSLRDASCTFEGREPGCMDSVPAWTSGLAYFDSLLASGTDTVESVRRLFWKHWKLRFIGQEGVNIPAAIFPRKILKSGVSGCVGITWLALMLEEARGVRIDAVLLPGHIFFRVNGKNLEPNRSGYSYTDEEYRKKYAAGPWTGYEFEPLYRKQFLGLVAFNMGNVVLESEPERALGWYKIAGEFFPAYPGIEANRLIALKKLERDEKEK